MKYLLLITLILPAFGFCQSHEDTHSEKERVALLTGKDVDHRNINKTFTNEINGQPIAYYINHSEIDSYSKAFYSGHLSVSDDSITFTLLDSVLTNNNNTRPFYLYNFCRIMELSDGALSEGLTDYCVEYILKFPCEYLNDEFMHTYKTEPANWEASIEFLLEGDELTTFFNKVAAKVKSRCPNLSTAWQSTKSTVYKRLDITE